ncbi:PQQ-dependent sugar dehydrogenase [Salana multivorans]
MNRHTVVVAAAGVLLLSSCASAVDEPTESGEPSESLGSTAPVEPSEPSESADLTDSAASSDVGVEAVTDALAVPREVIELDTGALLVSDQAGRIVVLEDGELRPEPLLDVTELILPPTGKHLELGLAGVALAPDFATSGLLYTFTTEPDAEDVTVDRIDRIRVWQVDLEALVADPATGTVLYEHGTRSLDHVGGELAFDDAGLLYASFGAPSGSGSAQDPNALPGSIIRIDPNGAGPMSVPEDNPYVTGGGLPEVYSYGYRNPWRLQWDAELGLVVGEALWTDKFQQVTIAQPGGNFGYPESGPACWVDGTLDEACTTTGAGVPIVPPVLEYDLEVGRILSGVVVARDPAIAAFDDHALVADWRGSLLLATPGEAPWQWEELEVPEELTRGQLWDMQQEGDQIYVAMTSTAMTDGVLYRLVGAG